MTAIVMRSGSPADARSGAGLVPGQIHQIATSTPCTVIDAPKLRVRRTLDIDAMLRSDPHRHHHDTLGRAR